jgi:Dolichyl-phosphate-mannose-protein mannosyltransferase
MAPSYAAPDQVEWRPTSTQIFVLLIVLAFAVPRLALLVTASGMPLSDAKWYFDRAISIAHGDGYAYDGTPTAFWPIGYPGFLAILFSVFPNSPSTGIFANFLLSATTIACSFGIYRQVGISTALALLGVLVLTLFPNLIFYQNLLMSEILMTTLLSLSLLGLIASTRSYQYLLTGLCFGLTTLVKSQVVFLPVLILIYDLFKSARRGAVAYNYSVLAIGMLIVVLPWTMRNYLVFERFILVQSNGGYNLLMGNNEKNRWGGSTGSGSEFAAMFPGVIEKNQPFSDEMGMSDRASSTALGFIAANPVAVIKRVPYKLYRFFRHDPQGIGALLRSNAAAGKNLSWLSSIFPLSFWYHTTIMGAAILSLFVFISGPLQTRAHFVLLSTIFYFALIAAVFFGEGRFHIPLLPAFVGCMLVTLHAVKATFWPVQWVRLGHG